MAWWAPLAISGGVGLAKHFLVDKPREKRDRLLAAQTQMYSPWTGLKAEPVQEADAVGTALQTGAAGASFWQGLQQAQREQELTEAMRDWYKSPKSSFGGAPSSVWKRYSLMNSDYDQSKGFFDQPNPYSTKTF